jgi:hypothetical protein
MIVTNPDSIKQQSEIVNTVNVCIRCGKPRVVSKKWTEVVTTFMGKGVVTHIEKTCPDKECQKIVDEKLSLQRQKSKAIRDAKEERINRIKQARTGTGNKTKAARA